MMEHKEVYNEIIDKLKNKNSFSFVRWGDGEWAIIFKNEIYNHIVKKWGDVFENSRYELLKILESKPDYYFGIQNFAYSKWKEDIDRVTLNFTNLVKADTLHNKSKKGLIYDFFESLKDRNVVLVAPEYLNNIKEFKFSHHIITQEYYVWDKIDEIENNIKEYLKENIDKNPVFLYSCSIAAKILIHKFRDQQITQIDTGSLLDPYVGMNSRSYHADVLKRLNVDESTFKYPKIK